MAVPDSKSNSKRLLDLGDSSPLNQPERELADELAYLVADKMWRDLGADTIAGEVHNLAQSNYEAGCRALNLVGVYQKGKHHTQYKVVIPAGGVHQHMASLKTVSREALNELLSAFVENYVSYDATLSSGRRCFPVHPNLTRAADLLAANGFAEKQQDEFKWTEKIGPTMKRCYIWDENGECRAEREQILRDKTAANMAETLPWFVRRKVDAALKKHRDLTALKILSKHWNGEKWLIFPFFREKPGASSQVDIRLLKLLIQKLK